MYIVARFQYSLNSLIRSVAFPNQDVIDKRTHRSRIPRPLDYTSVINPDRIT